MIVFFFVLTGLVCFTAGAFTVALRERDQYRRDAELLALMARDRRVALEFIATQHRIDRLEETR